MSDHPQLTVQIDPLWQERLRAMAKSAGVEPGHYLEMLLRRAYRRPRPLHRRYLKQELLERERR